MIKWDSICEALLAECVPIKGIQELVATINRSNNSNHLLYAIGFLVKEMK